MINSVTNECAGTSLMKKSRWADLTKKNSDDMINEGKLMCKAN